MASEPEAAPTASGSRGRRSGLAVQRGVGHLSLHQPVVHAALGQQGLVVAALHQPAVIEHEDVVAVAHARQSMRHDQRRAALHQAVQRCLDRGLVLGVDAGERLVQDQHRRIAQQCSGNRDPLTFAARESMPALADHRGIALGQRSDELVRVGRLRGGADLVLGRVRSGESQVGQHAAVEQIGVLQHDRHLRADVVEPQRVDVPPANPDRPLLRRVEPLQQPDQG